MSYTWRGRLRHPRPCILQIFQGILQEVARRVEFTQPRRLSVDPCPISASRLFSYLPFFYSDVNNPEQMMKYEAVEHFLAPVFDIACHTHAQPPSLFNFNLLIASTRFVSGPGVPAVRQEGVQHLRQVRQGQERQQGQHRHHGHHGAGLKVGAVNLAVSDVFV